VSTNIFVVKLLDIRSEFPDSGEAISRIEALLTGSGGARPEYSLEHLYEVVHPKSLRIMAEILSWLTEHRYIDRIYRVVSPKSGAGLADFTSLREVPHFIVDEVDTGEEIPITDENLEIVYRLKTE
jgi:hypothetical protein